VTAMDGNRRTPTTNDIDIDPGNLDLSTLSREEKVELLRRWQLDRLLLLPCAEIAPSMISFAGRGIPAAPPLPPPLDRFLDEFLDHGDELEHRLAAEVAMRAKMADLGVRVFRHALIAGLYRGGQRPDNDLEWNRSDALAAAGLLATMALEFGRTPFVPTNVSDFLVRVADGLQAMATRNGRPAVFRFPEGETAAPPTFGVQAEAMLAVALEVAVAGGTKLAAAKRWLDAETKKAGIVDGAGNPVSAERVAAWRGNFRKGIGAKDARSRFTEEVAQHRVLIAQPPGPAKRAACLDLAKQIVWFVFDMANRTISAAPAGIKRRPRRAPKKG
jgi:hypothetical protein